MGQNDRLKWDKITVKMGQNHRQNGPEMGQNHRFLLGYTLTRCPINEKKSKKTAVKNFHRIFHGLTTSDSGGRHG